MGQILQVGVAKQEDCRRFTAAPGMNVPGCLLMALSFRSVAHAQYIVGADTGYLKQAEDGGTIFKENGVAKPGLVVRQPYRSGE